MCSIAGLLLFDIWESKYLILITIKRNIGVIVSLFQAYARKYDFILEPEISP